MWRGGGVYIGRSSGIFVTDVATFLGTPCLPFFFFKKKLFVFFLGNPLTLSLFLFTQLLLKLEENSNERVSTLGADQ